MSEKLAHGLLLAAARKRPGLAAIEHEDGRSITYAGLVGTTAEVAGVLARHADKGRPICGLFLPSCIAYGSGALGILRAGRIFMPLDRDYPTERFRKLLDIANPGVILTLSQDRKTLEHLLYECGYGDRVDILQMSPEGRPEQYHRATANGHAILWDAVDGAPPFDDIDVSPEADAYVIYTSGTTGVPKAIRGWHKALCHYVHWQANEFAPHFLNDSGARIAQLAPSTFEASLKDYFVALASASTLCIPSESTKSNAARLVDWISEARLTVLQCVPSYLRLIYREIDGRDAKAWFPNLTLVLQSGDALYGRDVTAWRGLVGTHTAMANLYGPAEVTLLKTCRHIAPEEEFRPGEIVPVGTAISNSAVLILNGDTLCPVGRIGEICVKSPFLARGYLGNEELTKKHFVKNPLGDDSDIIYRSGDLGRYRKDRSIDFVGRGDSQVKVHGNRIELGEVKAAVIAHPLVRDAEIVANTNAEMDTSLVCYYTSSEAVEQASLRETMLSLLPDYMVPAFFVRLEAFPMTISGKIDKKALPKPEALLFAEGEIVKPEGATETALSAIWAEILGLSAISVTKPFVEMGGDSLRAIRVISRIYKDMGVEVNVREFFESATVRALSRRISAAIQMAYTEIAKVADKPFHDVSDAQRRLWFLNQIDRQSHAYNVAGSMLIEGALDVAAFARAFDELMARHESLRTTFPMHEGAPVQVIHKSIGPGLVTIDLSAGAAPEVAAREFYRQEAAQPFDLEHGPLARVHLLVLGPESYVFVYNLHHIISDDWSLGVIMRDLAALYRAHSTGQSPHLPAMRIQYRDYSAWRASVLASPRMSEHRQYWHRKFSGSLPVLQLPADAPRPPVKTYNGNTRRFSMPAQVSDSVKAFAARMNVSTFTVIFSVMRALLYRYTAQEDVILGLPLAGRTHPDLEHQVGYYLNTLAIRASVGGMDTFTEVVSRINQSVTEAQEHQSYPFDNLVDELDLQRDVSRMPLFDIMLSYQGAYQQDVELLSLKTRAFDEGKDTSKFDMGIIFIETDSALDMIVEYNTDLYLPQRIERFGAHFDALMRAALAEPGALVKDLAMLTADDRELLARLNDTAASYPQDATVVSLIEQRAQSNPDAIATIHEQERRTYAQLNERANRIARLLSDCGVGPGHRAALLMEPSADTPAELLGVLKTGAAYVPVDVEYPESRVAHMLRDSAAPIILTKERHLRGRSVVTLTGLDHVPAPPCLTGQRGQVRDITKLPIVNRSVVDYEGRYIAHIGQAMAAHTMSIQATRGCPYHCAYCHKIWPKSHVYRPAEHLFAEVKALYDIGLRRFAFIDDIFNFNKKNSSEFFQMLIRNNMKVQMFFPNGVRGDILTPEYIDLMVEAGTVNMALALETASPRMQKLIGKNLDIGKLRENVDYLCSKHPGVILELFTMHGFPSETEEEALQTLQFVKDSKWLHFPYVHILKIFPDSEMEALALAHGVSREAIDRSVSMAFHELPETLPFAREFTLRYQGEFFNSYFMSKQRLLSVLPHQMQSLTEDELVQKYDSYLPAKVSTFDELLSFCGITRQELGGQKAVPDDEYRVIDLNRKLRETFPVPEAQPGAMRVLLLDLSKFFPTPEGGMLYDVAEPPLGLMSLMSHLYQEFGGRVEGRIAKSGIDFMSFAQLRELIDEFKPELIGLRTLTFYHDFFHLSLAMIKQFAPDVPVIAGGPYATSSYAKALRDPNLDLVVMGEGEVTLAEIVGRMLDNGHRFPAQEELRQIAGCAIVEEVHLPARKAAYRRLLVLDYLEDRLATLDPSNPPLAAKPDDRAYVLYTSGSTGLPKGTIITHRNVVRLLVNDRLQFDFDKRAGLDTWIMSHSYCFDFSTWEMYGALFYGGRLVIPPRPLVRDTAKYLDLLLEHEVSVLNQTPGAFYNLIAEVERRDTRALDQHLRWVIFGGDRLEPAYLKPWAARFGLERTKLINMYGITETTVHVTFHQLTARDLERHDGASLIGGPIPETTLHILDGDGNLVPPGVPGEMYVGGSGVGGGYLNREELTNERFINNTIGSDPSPRLYKSGDLGRLDFEGILHYLGRNDDQVQVRGFRIELGEITHRMVSHHLVSECVVIPRVTEEGVTQLSAYIVWKHGDGLTVEALRAYLGAALPEYMLPAHYVSIDAIPLTSNGKVDKSALPDPTGAAGALGLGTDYVAPRNETERRIAEVWTAVLKRDRIGVDDNYFSLGGDSIKAIQVVARLREHGLKVEVLDIFRSPTVAALAQCVKDLGRVAEQGPITGEVPLGPIQRWFFQAYKSDRHHYNQSVMLECQGRVDEAALRLAIVKVLEHHDALRARFEAVDGGIVQEIMPPDAIYVADVLSVVEVSSRDDAYMKAEAFQATLELGRDAHAPLFRAQLYRLPEGDLLMVVAHHLVVDGVSWRVLAEDLTQSYMKIRTGQSPSLPPKTDSYKAWTEALAEAASGQALRAEMAHWQATMHDEPGHVLPIESGAMEHSTVADLGRIAFTLDADITRALLGRVHEAYNTGMDDVLVTALALAAQRTGAGSKFAVNMEGHGRERLAGMEDIDVSRTVGWFTSLYPVMVELPDNTDLGYRIRYVKEGLRKVPGKGIGYGVLRYMAEDGAHAALSHAQGPRVSFNYLGQFEYGGGHFRPAATQPGNNQSPSHPLLHDVEITAQVEGGPLTVNIAYDARKFHQGAVTNFGRAYMEVLREIIEHCQGRSGSDLTPSDIDFQGLSIEQLDDVLSEFDGDLDDAGH